MDTVESELVPEYAQWLERVTATHDAVAYTCRIRLGDPGAGEAVALRVTAGLIARPRVFRHWGLPYSGRIAKLAEDAITETLAGCAGPPGEWGPLRRALAAIPPQAQETFVLTCVEGLADQEIAERCGCDTASASTRRASVLGHMRALAALHGGPSDEG